MLDPAQLGIELSQLKQRTLLHYFSFHVPLLSTFHGSVRTRTDPHRQRVTELAAQELGRLGTPRELTGPVRDVDQRHVGRAPVFVGGMVPQVGGDVGLHAGAGDGVEQRVTRSPAHRDPRHRRVGITRGAHPPRGGGQRIAHPRHEGRQRLRRRQ